MVPVIIIIMLAYSVTTNTKPGAGAEAFTAEAAAARLAPVGQVAVKAAGDLAAMKTGEQVFQAQCSACHATGAAGAQGGRCRLGARASRLALKRC